MKRKKKSDSGKIGLPLLHLNENIRLNVESLYNSQKSGKLVFQYLSGLYFSEMKNLLGKNIQHDEEFNEWYFIEENTTFYLTLMKSATYLFNKRIGSTTKKNLGKERIASNIFQPNFWIHPKGAYNKLGIYSGMHKYVLDDYVHQAAYLYKYEQEIKEKLQVNFFDHVSISDIDWSFIPAIRGTINTQLLGTDYRFTFKNDNKRLPNPKLFNIKKEERTPNGKVYKYHIQEVNTKDMNEVIDFLKNDPEYTSQRLKYKLNNSITNTIIHSGIF